MSDPGEPGGTPPPEPGPPPLPRLDPSRGLADAQAPPPPAPPPAPFDTRRYRWAIGIFGLVLVIGLSVYGFASNGVGSPGVAAGMPLHRFVAPLATSGLDFDANAHPRCDPAHPNPLGLNVCNRAPIVLAFFVTGSASCERAVDALQAVSREPGFGGITFGAVAIHAGRRATLARVRRHHWTIPVAYDRDGSLGDLYGVEICPLLELARANGIVAQRLIGDHWDSAAAVAAEVRQALRP